MENSLKGKVALITGGTKGIGKAVTGNFITKGGNSSDNSTNKAQGG